MRYTPDIITWLGDNEIFVFGSNLAGIHGAGAAQAAYRYYGARYGTGNGPAGRSYAIPTKRAPYEEMGVEEIAQYVREFINYAYTHPEYTYLVTPVGCGLAGHTPATIAPLFAECLDMVNVVLPRAFCVQLGAV